MAIFIPSTWVLCELIHCLPVSHCLSWKEVFFFSRWREAFNPFRARFSFLNLILRVMQLKLVYTEVHKKRWTFHCMKFDDQKMGIYEFVWFLFSFPIFSFNYKNATLFSICFVLFSFFFKDFLKEIVKQENPISHFHFLFSLFLSHNHENMKTGNENKNKINPIILAFDVWSDCLRSLYYWTAYPVGLICFLVWGQSMIMWIKFCIAWHFPHCDRVSCRYLGCAGRQKSITLDFSVVS